MFQVTKEFTPSAMRKLNCNMSAVDDYYDSDDDGGSSLTESIFGSLTQLGTAAIISQAPGSKISTPVYSRPVYSTPSFGSGGSFASILIIVVLAIVGFFAFKKL